jgi:hypothetical protein
MSTKTQSHGAKFSWNTYNSKKGNMNKMW